MKTVLSEYAMCNNCTHEVLVKEILDDVNDAWPSKSWISHKCPTCGDTNHYFIANGFIKTGYLDGAPGPCFIIKDHISLEKFIVKSTADKMLVKTLNLKWEFRKK